MPDAPDGGSGRPDGKPKMVSHNPPTATLENPRRVSHSRLENADRVSHSHTKPRRRPHELEERDCQKSIEPAATYRPIPSTRGRHVEDQTLPRGQALLVVVDRQK